MAIDVVTGYQYSQLTSINRNQYDEITALMYMLSENFRGMSFEHYCRVIDSPSNAIYVAFHEGKTIVGVLMRLDVVQFVGSKSWIEDVVTHEEHRGHGIASALLRMAISEVPEGTSKISLTSKQSRVEARKLYAKYGFKVYETTVFRKNLLRSV